VGIESIGSTADKVIDEARKRIALEKVAFPDNPSLFPALEQGWIDAAVQGEFSSAWVIRNNPKLAIAARISNSTSFRTSRLPRT
jgi:hypothetical protein